MADALSDGLLVLPGDGAARNALAVRDDRDDLYVLHDVATAAVVAHAVVRRTGPDAVVTHVSGPAELTPRLLEGVCEALRAAGASTLTTATATVTAL
ncbi:hypothetical protein [Dactylosporangium darangshiense]|uniref:Uncharacterized protein n=1 Tax=Dactylosporangium darangshiense TaxID=579108 RepID=A0ABP8DIP0_9ACTN